jgi:hypothetical protein
LRRSKDPLTAATTSILMPALQAHGFIRVTNRLIARDRNLILQSISLQLSQWGNRMFCVNYAVNSLFRPREFLTLSPGGRLKRRRFGGEVWWDSDTHEKADEAMQEVTSLILSKTLPWFDKCDTVKGLYKILSRERWGSRHHLEFEKACCLARLGRLDEAKDRLDTAIKLFIDDGRDWTPQYVNECQDLIDAIERGNHDQLLSDWVEWSIGQLRLGKLYE